MRMVLGTMIRNIAVAALISLPLTIGISAVALAVWPPDWMRSTLFTSSSDDIAAGGVMWFLILVIPTVLGAALHQVVLLIHARLRPTGHARSVVVLSSPVVLLGFAVIPRATPGTLSAPVLLPVLVLVASYAVLAKALPVQPTSDSGRDLSAARSN